MAKKPIETRLVDAVIGELEDRKGFDHWWHEMDDEIKDEIVEALEDKVRKIIEIDNLKRRPS